MKGKQFYSNDSSEMARLIPLKDHFKILSTLVSLRKVTWHGKHVGVGQGTGSVCLVPMVILSKLPLGGLIGIVLTLAQ